jgi:hypothetical protein
MSCADRPFNTDSFAGGLHSRVSTPSITIDEFEMDDHDYEHVMSEAFQSKGDNPGQFDDLKHQYSDDDTYHSIKSDDEQASPLPCCRHHGSGLNFYNSSDVRRRRLPSAQ